MRAIKDFLVQNRIFLRPMSHGEASLSRYSSPPPFAPRRGAGRVVAPVLLAIAASALAAGILARVPGELLLWIVLSSFAVLGVFLLLGSASGLIRIGERTAFENEAKAVLASLEAGVLVTDRHGDPLYGNDHDLAQLVGRALGGLDAPGAASDRGSEANEPFFRLIRAAARGEPRREHFAFASGGVTRWIRVDARPFQLPGARTNSEPVVLWQIADLTQERVQQTRAVDQLRGTLARYDAMPVGLLTTSEDGTVTHVNAALAGWLGAAPETLIERDLKLDDLLSNDGVQLLSAWARQTGGAGIDLELTREDGGLLPVRLLARPSGGGHAIAVLNYEEDAARRDETLAEVRFARFFRSAPFGIATVGPDGRLISANAAFSRMMLDGETGTGEPARDILCRNAGNETAEAIEAGLKQVLSGRGKVAPIDLTLGGTGGGTGGGAGDRARRLYMTPVAGSRRAREAAVLYTIDSSEQKALEAKLAQSQKMDAVGKLAGGIAHDFNNVLTVIIGYSDLLLQKHRQNDPAYQEIMNIKSSANRAASLVGKLLAFSRQQTMQTEALLFDEVLTDLAPFLKRSIGEKIELDIPPGRDIWHIKADRTQIEHVIINLAVNARDAMPSGGKVSIRTRNVAERESLRLGRAGLAPGEYVLIEVEDTGVGMTPEVMAKIFEPFFTTKGVGKGTGLGLATVYGIVKQTGGFIFPDSEPGKGTTFRVYLPRHHLDSEDETAAAVAKAAKKEAPADLTGTGRVLLVEDEDMVRGFAVRALKSRGYDVLEASTGAEALEVMDRNEGKIDIVISDVVMPEMDGPTLLKELRKKNPNLKIIFISGYPNDAFKASLDDDTAFAFLPKPFSLPQLAAKVKEELG